MYSTTVQSQVHKYGPSEQLIVQGSARHHSRLGS